MSDATHDKGWFGHPKGLSTLFFTEMWERLSYYGMRALLILYMTGLVTDANSGLSFGQDKAATIYGTYTALVYALALPGGIIADRWLGHYRAVFIGGLIIAIGHFLLAVQSIPFFFAGLAFIVVGTGLLKPNISTMVGSLYEEGDARRDGGFSLFYMGINVGAFLAPFVCGTLGQKIGWHWGFAAAGVGMVLGLVQYWFGRGRLSVALARIEERKQTDSAAKAASTAPSDTAFAAPMLLWLLIVVAAALALNYFMSPLFGSIIGIVGVIGIAFKFMPNLKVVFTGQEWQRLGVIAVLFIFSTLFWAAFEQAGSSLNQFADIYTNTSLLGWEFPSTWFQSLNPFYIVVFAPLYSLLWVWLSKRNAEPAAPMKFVWGMILVGGGFLLLIPAAKLIESNPAVKVSAMWLVGVYLFHTLGELCLSPVSLSMVTKLAPQKIVGSMMGFWFLSYSLGNFVSGQIARFFPSGAEGSVDVSIMGTIFLYVFFATAGSGILLLLFVKPLTKMMGGIK